MGLSIWWRSVVTSRSISPRPPPTSSRTLRSVIVITVVRLRAIFSSSSSSSGSHQDNGSVSSVSCSALYFRSFRVKPNSVHTAAHGDRPGRGSSLPLPVSMPFTTPCNETISCPLSSSAGVIDPRHLLQCCGALLLDTSGGFTIKLTALWVPLRGEAFF